MVAHRRGTVVNIGDKYGTLYVAEVADYCARRRAYKLYVITRDSNMAPRPGTIVYETTHFVLGAW